VTNDFGNSVSILLGTGNGMFQAAPTVPVGRNPLAIKVADFNGDGRLDLIVANTNQNPVSEPGSLSILLGRGDGTFQTTSEVTVGIRPIPLAVADFNGDRRLDIAVVNQFGDPPLSILLGRGDGTFQAGTAVQIPILEVGGSDGLITADFNRDGRMDLAVVSLANYVSILLGQGDGTFETSILAGVGNAPHSGTTGDFNHDGLPDLATTDYESGTVSVLINNSAAKHCNQRHSMVSNWPDELSVRPERSVVTDALHRCGPLP